MANKNLGKSQSTVHSIVENIINLPSLTLINFMLASVRTDEEAKIAGPTVGELQQKKKAAAVRRAKKCRDPNAFNTYIFRVLK